MRPKHRPAWFTDAVLHKLRGKEKAARGAWKKQLQEDPAMRGVLLWQLSTLAQTVQEILTELDFVQDGPFAANPGSPLRWLDVNMYHVCQHFILPMTKEQECSYVELVASDLQPPEWMVSHAWSTQFAATASMLAKHSSSRNQEEDSAHSWKQTSYWCCTLANNQHDLSPLREADLLKTPFARVLLSNACAGTVLLCDTVRLLCTGNFVAGWRLVCQAEAEAFGHFHTTVNPPPDPSSSQLTRLRGDRRAILYNYEICSSGTPVVLLTHRGNATMAVQH